MSRYLLGYGYGHSSQVMLPGLTSVGVGGPAGVWAEAAVAAPITNSAGSKLSERIITTSCDRGSRGPARDPALADAANAGPATAERHYWCRPPTASNRPPGLARMVG